MELPVQVPEVKESTALGAAIYAGLGVGVFDDPASAARRVNRIERTLEPQADASEAYAITAGDRIAQLLVMPVTRARFIPVDRLPGTERGDGGFGSTGYRTAAPDFAASSATESPTHQSGVSA